MIAYTVVHVGEPGEGKRGTVIHIYIEDGGVIENKQYSVSFANS